jgi:hypothetical protein
VSASLWTSQTPALPDINEAQPVTVALTMTFAVAGTVSGIRFYGPATVGGGTYQGVLYQITAADGPSSPGTGAGTLLGSGTFGALTPGAWNTVAITPVAVTPGVAYRVGVRTSEGRYAATGGFFNASGLTNGNITAPQTGADPVGIGQLFNGAFIESIASYPSKTFNGNAYFVDVAFDAGTPVVVPDPVSGGAGTGGTLDGIQLGDASGGAGTGGTLDGRALGDASGGAGTGGSPDTITGPVVIFDSSGGAGTGGSVDQVSSGSLVVHDTMVMPILLQARACLVAEVGKLQFPPKRVQIRPGASFEFQADATTNECCDGIAWVRRGQLIPTANFPEQISDARPDGPGQYAIQLEIGIERCLPVAANAAGDIVTEAQWLQATINAEDDGAALRRVACCLRDVYGPRSVVENPVVALENGGLCGGQIMTLLVRALACDCVE